MKSGHETSLNVARRPVTAQIARIALPAIAANLSVPLLSIVDTSIVGHMGERKYIGAVALGGVIFNVLYWMLGFLRMGTSGLTSQAFGRGDKRDIALQLARPLALAAAVGALLALSGSLTANAAFAILPASQDVEPLAREYFRTAVCGAPAVLGLYVFSGWFLGMQNSRYPMLAAISQNLVNIAASLAFVYGAGFGITGVALGTVTAQYFGLSVCVVLWRVKYAKRLPRPALREITDVRGLSRFFSVNRDIFLRTAFLVLVMSYFTSAGAAMSDTILAVNSLLMQLFIIFSYFMDGFAYAGEALAGRYAGEQDRLAFSSVTKRLLLIGTLLAALHSSVYCAGGKAFLSLLTNDSITVAAAARYLPLAACVPAVSFGAFVLDGIYIGATAARLMLLSTFLAAAVFFGIFFAFRDTAANYALWGAFLAYLATRTSAEALLYRRMARRVFVLPPGKSP